jgi:oligoribonuclease
MLAWMDLEMTGLEPSRHVIVEIATLLTDDHLVIVAEGPDLVVHATPEELSHMGEFVTTMHTSSGLLPQIVASRVSVAEAQQQTLAFLREHISEPRSVPLCGNSIGTDRRFLQEYMPELEAFFHYRNVDVSTIKELARRWNPGVIAASAEKPTTHRALDDIRASIAELEHYRSTLFVAPTTA